MNQINVNKTMIISLSVIIIFLFILSTLFMVLYITHPCQNQTECPICSEVISCPTKTDAPECPTCVNEIKLCDYSPKIEPYEDCPYDCNDLNIPDGAKDKKLILDVNVKDKLDYQYELKPKTYLPYGMDIRIQSGDVISQQFCPERPIYYRCALDGKCADVFVPKDGRNQAIVIRNSAKGNILVKYSFRESTYLPYGMIIDVQANT